MPTIAPYTIEGGLRGPPTRSSREAWDELKGELGDLLFQSVFHARMAEEAGLFDLDDVATAIADKMVARHLYACLRRREQRENRPSSRCKDWESVKATERAARATRVVCWRIVALGAAPR